MIQAQNIGKRYPTSFYQFLIDKIHELRFNTIAAKNILAHHFCNDYHCKYR